MTDANETPAQQIAADLAVAIHTGTIRPDEKLPSQTQLMRSYGVAMATAAAGLAKLSATGLTRGQRGRGTFAQDPRQVFTDSPVLDVLAASSMCRTLAATTFGNNADTPTLNIGGSPHWGTTEEDEETKPPRQVDVSTLAALDRHVLQWMSEAFLSAARRLVGSGPNDADTHLIASARALLRDGARRPENQPGIAHHSGTRPAHEDVALRIWPERGEPRDPNSPPF